MVSEYITLSKSAYCSQNICFRCMCVEIGVCVCVCLHALECASDLDNNVFLLCYALKILKNISLSDEVWYHLWTRKLRLKLRTLPVIIVKFELSSFWLSTFDSGDGS